MISIIDLRNQSWGETRDLVDLKVDNKWRRGYWDKSILETARFLVQEAELKPIKDSLQHVYDKLGQKYDVPIFCINDPIEFSNEKFEDRGLI